MTIHKVQLIEQHARDVMDQITRLDLRLAHDFMHIDRVRRWACQIAVREGGVDLELVEAAALLHDIGLAFVEHRRDHARVGAERAARFLAEQGLFAEPEIAAIAEAIRCHSSTEGGGTLGAILRDADMLDLFGAVGIMRACTSKHALPEYDPSNVRGATWGLSAADFTGRFTGGVGIGPHIVDQLNFQISCYENLHTATAKTIARPLIAFMRSYLAQLDFEIGADMLVPPS